MRKLVLLVNVEINNLLIGSMKLTPKRTNPVKVFKYIPICK